jgi:nitroimidazol reductase NimA-like FMN-containing flavoprotein (pyridoxamine 5'-phosphate oxidase superfamily)
MWRLERMMSESNARYLTEATLPLRLACVTDSGWPIVVSLWYVYQDGKLYCATRKSAKILQHIKSGQKCAFEVSNNEPPYRGLRGRGTVTLQEGRGADVLRVLLSRYLRNVDSPFAKRLLAKSQEEIVIEIKPESTYKWDFTKRMRGATLD